MEKTDWTTIAGQDSDRGYTFKHASKETSQDWMELFRRKRVIKASEIPPLVQEDPYQARMVDMAPTGQSLVVTFFVHFAPGAISQRHYHMNEACFYVLEGKGYEIHDGERFDWEAGDVIIVPAGCVHRHVNADKNNPVKAWVIASLPLYQAVNLKAQRFIEHPWEGSI